jgi:hypothetical protein
MSKIAISGASTGTATFTIESPATSTNRTLTLPDNTGTILTNATTAGFPAGSVLQVVSATDTTSSLITSTSFVASGLDATITPSSATSKILVFVHAYTDSAASGRQIVFTVYRNATNLGDSSSGFGSVSSSVAIRTGFDFHYLDSPSTTNAITYELYVRSTTGAGVELVPFANAVQTITLMEIAG